MIEFDPKNWFWIVGGDETRVWSSGVRAYVTEWPADRVTNIADEIELYDVLAKLGLKSRAPSGPFSLENVRSAFANIDSAATGAANDAEALAIVAEEMGMTMPPLVGA